MVLAASALAIVTLALCVVSIATNDVQPTGWWIAGMALTLAVGELPLARIRFGAAQGEAYSVVEIAVLATLVALPPGWTPVLALSVSITSVLVGRTRVKVVFNTANAVVGSGSGDSWSTGCSAVSSSPYGRCRRSPSPSRCWSTRRGPSSALPR